MKLRQLIIIFIWSIVLSLVFSSPAFAARDKTAPSAPATLAATSVTTNSVTLTWAKSKDNVGVKYYLVYKDGIRVDATTTSLVISLSELSPGTSYSFYVKAGDAANNLSSASPTAKITTKTPYSSPAWQICPGGYVALTFDDGPYVGSTTALVSELRKYNVKATFFNVGVRVAAMPDLVRLEASQGEVANHTWDHRSASGATTGEPALSLQEVRDELSQTTAAIAAAGVPASTLFRPPYGDVTGELRQAEAEQGLLEAGWTVDTNDWQDPSAEAIATRALSVRPGGIVLMHDRFGTIPAVPLIVSGLLALGMCPGRVSYSAVPQSAWGSWTFNAAASAW